MTVVATSVFDDGVVVLSDSRASTDDLSIQADILQKIVGINDDLIIGYAGAVTAVNRTLTQVQAKLFEGKYGRKETIDIIRQAALEEIHANGDSFSLFAYHRDSEGWKAYGFTGSHFDSYEIQDVALIGSGSVISDQVRQLHRDLTSGNEELRVKADRLIWGASSALSSISTEGVGGMLQGLILTKGGATSVRSGFISMDPDSPPESKFMQFEDGKWVQSDLATGQQQVLMAPNQLTSADAHTNIFHNYEKSSGPKPMKWYVNTFLSALKFDITPNDIKTHGSLNALAPSTFPQQVKFQCYLTFYGPSTEHDLKLIHVDAEGNKHVILSEKFDNDRFPLEYEAHRNVQILIEAPGLHLLQCSIDGIVASTKAIYVGELNSHISMKKNDKILKKQQANLSHECLETTNLVYFSIGGQPAQMMGTDELLPGQFSTVISNHFPIAVETYVDCGVRAEQGLHELTVEFIDAASHQVITTHTQKFIANTSAKTKPLQGRYVMEFPKPGFYFVRLSVDEEIMGTIVLMADGNPPRMTFTLPDSELKKLETATYLLLAKRSIQSK